jgi:hypothetical protein
MMYKGTAGSISPQRVPIITPANGVNPIEVSITLPFLTADIEAPLPRWQTIILESFLPNNSLALLLTNLCDVPWNPYFLTFNSV